MTLVFRSLVLALSLALAWAGPYAHGHTKHSRGRSDSAITFSNSRLGNSRPAVYSRPAVSKPAAGPFAVSRDIDSSIQFGETSATSVQTSSGLGQQTNQGEASAVSVQQQTGLGGATQVTNNQGVINALQQASGGAGGSGGGSQSSNNQVNINSSQLQQNVDGTLVNVHDGNQGVVIINTNDENGAVVNTEIINNRPIAEETAESARCRFTCQNPLTRQIYCCDRGDNTRGKWDVHGGKCPPVRGLCNRRTFFSKCAHDGQCAKSDKCCFDTCAEHHICKTPDLA